MRKNSLLIVPIVQFYMYVLVPDEFIFSQEYYDHTLMKKNRSTAIETAKNAQKWGIILGKAHF